MKVLLSLITELSIITSWRHQWPMGGKENMSTSTRHTVSD